MLMLFMCTSFHQCVVNTYSFARIRCWIVICYYIVLFITIEHYFYLFLHVLRLINDKSASFNIDKDLLTKLSKNVPKKPSFLKRDLDARKQSNLYTLKFRLPQTEKLDGSEECTLWTPYNKRYNWGRLYLSQNFICFDSRVSKCYI